MKTIKALLALATVFLAISLITATVFASDESTGTATVSPVAPTITTAELWNMIETTDVNDTAIDPWSEYHFNFTVNSPNTMTDLNNVTILIWDNNTAVEGDADAAPEHITYTWVESTATWACPSLGANYIETSNCTDPGASSPETSFVFKLAYKLPKVANYENTGVKNWTIKAYAYDDTEPTANSGSNQSIWFAVTFYEEVIVTDTTHAWASVFPGTTGNRITTPADKIGFTVICNAAFNVTAKGNDTNLHSGANLIPIANVQVLEADDNSTALHLTDEYVLVPDMANEAAPTADTGVAMNMYIWLDVPEGTPAGDYVYELWIAIERYNPT